MADAAPPSQDRSRKRREALLRSTVAVLAERGTKGVTHRSVAEHAGLPQASTTYYFDSLDDMIDAAMRLHVAERVSEMDELTRQVRESGTADPEFIQDLLATLVDRSDEAVISLFEFYIEAGRNPAMREPVASALNAFENLASATLSALGVSEPERTAEGLIAIIDGYALHRVARGHDRSADASALFNALRAHLIASAMDESELAKRFAAISAPRKAPG